VIEAGDYLLEIPENSFFIDAWSNNFYFVLNQSIKAQEDSSIYVYDDSGKITKKFSSVWEWINGIGTTSFIGDRSDVSAFELQGYRKPEYKDSGEVNIHNPYKNPDIIKQFINNEESREWFESCKKCLNEKKDNQ